MKRNKVVLVNPGIHYVGPKMNQGLYPNTAIMILATILHNAGFRVKVIDGRYLTVDDAVESISREINKDLAYIGFSVMTIQLPWAYRVSQAIKSRHPDTLIVWGGTHPTLFPEQTVEDPAVDIVVVNDAAATVSSLSLNISEGTELAKIPGIVYKENSNIIKTPPNQDKDDFSNVPYIDFSLLDHKRYSRNNNMAIEVFYGGKYQDRIVYPLLAGLGCSYRCTFCINVILERKYYYRSAEEIVERIKFLQGNYGADFIHPMDENFFISKKRTFELLDLLEKENIHVKWRPQSRPDHFADDYINVDVAKRLDRSGMIVVAMGAESASKEMLDKLRKNLKVEQMIKAVEILSKTNIVPKMNFMVGLPGETEADIKKTFQLAFRLRRMVKKSCISVVSFRPYPGSELYDELVSKYGYVPPSNLRDWTKLSERELRESTGYESFEHYKWVENRRDLEARLSVYNNVSMYNPDTYARIRALISSIRLRLNFFRFTSLDRKFFAALYILGAILSKIGIFASNNEPTHVGEQ